MTTVTILVAAKITEKKLAQRLLRAGCTVEPHEEGLLVTPVIVSVRGADDLPADTVEIAEQLLGLPPRIAVTCRFEGPVSQSPAWPTVVDIARAVAAEVPLAVLDDHTGISYLVHKVRGLIAPVEYEKARGRPPTNEVLRRMLGN
jgi:hypothetical protein